MMWLVLCTCLAYVSSISGGDINKRVVGFGEAPPGEYPWAIQIKAFDACGASLISKEWILTAAHCVYFGVRLTLPDDWHIQAGNVFRRMGYEGVHEEGLETVNNSTRYHGHISKVIPHPDYDFHSTSVENDVALLKLSKPLPLDEISNVSTVALPPSDIGTSWPEYGEMCVMVGWGCTEAYGSTVERAKLAELPIRDTAQCLTYYYGAGNEAAAVASEFNKMLFCAGYYDQGNGVCSGDSGSGLVCKKDGVWTLAGTTSATHPDRPGDYPGMFSRVSYFRDWIDETMANN